MHAGFKPQGERIEDISTDLRFTSCRRHRQAKRQASYKIAFCKIACHKIVALVPGANIVRRELVLPVADCLAADPHLSLVPPGS